MAEEFDIKKENAIKDNPATKRAEEIVVHTYEDDLALAMNTTEVGVVQEMLQSARERESKEERSKVINSQRKWYTTGGIILLILALGAAAYGIYYYRSLTVQVSSSPSVGVFPNTEAIYADENLFPQALDQLSESASLAENKPALVPILSDKTTNSLLDVNSFFNFLQIEASEPFLNTLSLSRLGLMDNGMKTNPFLIFSVPNSENASKEFLIAEPRFLEMFSEILKIDLSNPAIDVDPGFTSTFMYNLPVRTLKSTNLDTKEEMIVLYYGYANDTTIVAATDPSILKAIYDTIIRQR